MKKLISLLTIILSLQSCIPAVFVTGAAVGGAVIYDHRSTKTMMADRDITFRVQAQLSSVKELRQKAHITVVTFNRILLLLGQAPDEELRARAETIAKANPKVKMVYNEITIGPPISTAKRANDVWLTAKIKAMLLATPGLNSTNLKVVTENGAVYLMGLTTRTQAQIAVDKTRAISGVQKVVKLFEYLN